MKIAVVGGGINGLMIAKELAIHGHNVSIFERKKFCAETSSKSSKLLHGGIRYLENLQFALVAEGLYCRKKWLEEYPKHTEVKKFFIPIYTDTKKSTFLLWLGVKLYDFFAGKYSLAKSSYHSKKSFIAQNIGFKSAKLKSALSYYDVVMNDKKLIEDIVSEVKNNCKTYEDTEVLKMNVDGNLSTEFLNMKFDLIINSCGPWVNNHISNYLDLDFIRGSHIVVKRNFQNPILKINDDGRVIFIIPNGENCIIGTTEVRQQLTDPVECSDEEIEYLLKSVNQILEQPIKKTHILFSYAGIRPIIKKGSDFSKSSRDSEIIIDNKLVCIYGGKWTSSNILGKKLIKRLKKNKLC